MKAHAPPQGEPSTSRPRAVAAAESGLAHGVAASPRMAAQRATIAAAFGSGTRGAVVQRVAFGPATTYGLEIEFTNRWLTLLNDGKELPPLALAAGALRAEPASPPMTVGGDDGRVGTVMEIESQVFAEGDFSEGRVHAAADAMLATSNDIVARYRAENPGLVAEELEAVHETLGTQGQGHDLVANSQALLDSLNRGSLDEDQQSVVEDLETIAAGRAEEALATLQITTLGQKGPAHNQALAETSAEIEAQNTASMGADYPDPQAVQQGAAGTVAQWLQDLAPQAADDPDCLQHFVVLLECAVKIVLFAERGIGSARYGTIKNMPHVLPRRPVVPPEQGFAAALQMNPDAYRDVVKVLQQRLDATSGHADATAQGVLTLLARGSSAAATERFEKRAQEHADAPDGERPFSLWALEEGWPTQEAAIIAKAAKAHPEAWTAHEIRNFAWAQGINAEQLRAYLDIMRRRAVEG